MTATTTAATGTAYYHGTRYALEVGQELTASGARRANPAYPRHIRHAWVTTGVLNAVAHATKHGREFWDAGHVYLVEPLSPADVELDPLDNGSRSSWRSTAGFRVVRDMGTPAQLWGLDSR